MLERRVEMAVAGTLTLLAITVAYRSGVASALAKPQMSPIPVLGR